MELTVTVDNTAGPMLERARARVAAGEFRRLTATWGLRLQAQVKANAAGRPGPRMVTGDYNRSIGLQVSSAEGEHTAVVGTNKPQARRLEYGFVSVDARGRRFSQPPFPHFGPAADKIRSQFEAAAKAAARGVLR